MTLAKHSPAVTSPVMPRFLTAHWRHLVRLYGEGIGTVLGEPCSAFVAEGSPIMVCRGRRIV